MSNLPAMQFYPGDWLRNNVSGCSLAAQGLWLRMIILAHDSDRYGYLVMNGSPIPSLVISRRCGCDSVEQYETLLAELFAAGVPRQLEDGTIYSKRMVDDAKKRSTGAARVDKHRSNGRCNAPVTPPVTVDVTQDVTPLKHPSSSSVSVSEKKEREPTAWKAPNINEVIDYGKSMNCGLSEEECRKFFNYYDSLEWVVNGSLITKWKPRMLNWRSEWMSRVRDQPRYKKPQSQPDIDPQELKFIEQMKEKMAREGWDNPAPTA